MPKNKKKEPKELTDEEIEQMLDQTWENWSSRRQCESKHVPEYIKRQEKGK